MTAAPQAAGAAPGAVTAPKKVLVTKVGLDGHDRGVKVVARMLRDAGFEVIYGGLRQTPDTVAAMALQEDVDAIGLSMHSGAHLTLAPAVIDALARAGLETPVVIGGIVPPRDIPLLLERGVTDVLAPGASQAEVVEAIRQAIDSTGRRSNPKASA